MAGQDAMDDPLTQLLRAGARRLIEKAGCEAELAESPAKIEATQPEGIAGTGHRRLRDEMLHMMLSWDSVPRRSGDGYAGSITWPR